LPVLDLLFIGKKTVPVLERMGIHTIGELAKYNRDELMHKLGQFGGMIHDYANGKDDSPVNPVREENKSAGNGETFEKDISKFELLYPRVLKLADSVGQRLRKKELKTTTIQVAIKSPDFKVIQRQRKIEPSNVTKEIAQIVMEIIKEKWKDGKPIRAVTITASNLTANDTPTQMSFFGEDKEKMKNEKLQTTIDKLNEKFGKNTLKLGSQE